MITWATLLEELDPESRVLAFYDFFGPVGLGRWRKYSPDKIAELLSINETKTKTREDRVAQIRSKLVAKGKLVKVRNPNKESTVRWSWEPAKTRLSEKKLKLMNSYFRHPKAGFEYCNPEDAWLNKLKKATYLDIKLSAEKDQVAWWVALPEMLDIENADARLIWTDKLPKLLMVKTKENTLDGSLKERAQLVLTSLNRFTKKDKSYGLGWFVAMAKMIRDDKTKQASEETMKEVNKGGGHTLLEILSPDTEDLEGEDLEEDQTDDFADIDAILEGCLEEKNDAGD